MVDRGGRCEDEDTEAEADSLDGILGMADAELLLDIIGGGPACKFCWE